VSDWIPALAGLRTHPKTRRAARLLEMEPEPLIGHLICLWWWALEYAPDGDLEDFDEGDLADAAGWPGGPAEFVAALLDSGAKGRPGFLARVDGRLVIHDWEDNQGPQFRGRIQAANRKRNQRLRERDADPAEGDADVIKTRSSHAGVTGKRDSVTPRARKGPTDRQDRPTGPTVSSNGDCDFAAFWGLYPRRESKRDAERAFKAACRRVRAETVLETLRSHLPAIRSRERQFIPLPATWLNRDPWEDEPTPPPKSGCELVDEYWGAQAEGAP